MNSKQIEQTGNAASAQTSRNLTRRDFLRLTLVATAQSPLVRWLPCWLAGVLPPVTR